MLSKIKGVPRSFDSCLARDFESILLAGGFDKSRLSQASFGAFTARRILSCRAVPYLVPFKTFNSASQSCRNTTGRNEVCSLYKPMVAFCRDQAITVLQRTLQLLDRCVPMLSCWQGRHSNPLGRRPVFRSFRFCYESRNMRSQALCPARFAATKQTMNVCAWTLMALRE